MLPAFSHACIRADPAGTETFFPSIVSSTSAARRTLEEKCRDALLRPAAALERVHAPNSCRRMMPITRRSCSDGEGRNAKEFRDGKMTYDIERRSSNVAASWEGSQSRASQLCGQCFSRNSSTLICLCFPFFSSSLLHTHHGTVYCGTIAHANRNAKCGQYSAKCRRARTMGIVAGLPERHMVAMKRIPYQRCYTQIHASLAISKQQWR